MTMAVQKAPRITRNRAAQIAAELYGLNVSAAPLPSERDQNFLLCVDSLLSSPPLPSHPNRTARSGTPASGYCPGPSQSATGDERFVLKIANSEEAFEF